MSNNINFGERRNEKKALGAKKSGLRATSAIDSAATLTENQKSTTINEYGKQRNIAIPEKAAAQSYSMYPSSKELLTKLRVTNAPRLSDAKYLQNLIFKDAFGRYLFDPKTGQPNVEAWEMLDNK